MERVQVLRSKLRQDLLWEIRKFDAHPTADLIRRKFHVHPMARLIKGLKFSRFPGGLSIKTDKGYMVVWSDWVRE